MTGATEQADRARALIAARQEQFLDVVDRDEALRRFHGNLALVPLGAELVPLGEALGRVLAAAVVAPIDVPGFDRSGVDGFAVRAEDTRGAREDAPVALELAPEVLTPGVVPGGTLARGTAAVIATGGMVPRGADAVVMVEHTDLRAGEPARIDVRRAATPGQFVAFAGSDIARGETALHAGQALSSREIGVLAALGFAEVEVVRRPRVAILSTGDEIVAPGAPMRPGAVYDSNAAIVAAAVTEAGGEPIPFGIARDDESELGGLLERALAAADAVILSGGTSKGAGDVGYRVVGRLGNPGVLVHGVALKPGKPLLLAVSDGKPVAILPGFPTSAIFTFHEFVAPAIRAMAGLPSRPRATVSARLAFALASERGRTEYAMVSLLRAPDPSSGLVAYPLAKGSGAVTGFSQADGFIAIDRHAEGLPAGAPVTVQLIGREVEPADLVVIGSQCVGLDILVGLLRAQGLVVKSLAVGSTGGLAAARRGECDVAPIHLLDPDTGAYNHPFVGQGLRLVAGYRRRQGIVHRPDDRRFSGRRDAEDAIAAALSFAPDCLMINRNAGSGTRILTDRMLAGARPPGYWVQAKSHNAVAVAVAQGRADWGMAIETVARAYGLGFAPGPDEHYDFVIPEARAERAPVRRFLEVLAAPATRRRLAEAGFAV
jgi:putative molybdopterin biosynthesis protein